MKMDRLIVFMIVLWGVIGCSDDDGGELLPVPERVISLQSAIGQSTRGVIGSSYDEDLVVCFARQDETDKASESYEMWNVYKAVRTGGSGSRPIVFDDLQLYPNEGRNIRLHGYYPAEGKPAAGKVTFMLDGMTDIMATGKLTANAYAPVQDCTFRHLLTQVRLLCYSDHADQWGTIVKIEAMDVHTQLELDLAAETPRLDDLSSGDEVIKNIFVQDITDLSIPQIKAGDEQPDPQGYILLPVSPVDGTKARPLQLRITTTKDGRGNGNEMVSDVFVHVEGGFLTGKSHVISLFFTASGGIQATSVGVEPWTDREQGDIPI